MNKMLFHYTVGIKIRSIIDSGVILASPLKPKPREKAIAWLSSNNVFEKTANKIILKPGDVEGTLLDQKGTEEMCKGLFRFGVNPENYPGIVYGWPRVAVEARIPPKIKKLLVSRAKKAKVNPEQWHGVIGNIDIVNTSLEQYINGVWTPISFEEAMPVENGYTIESRTMNRLPVADESWKKV